MLLHVIMIIIIVWDVVHYKLITIDLAIPIYINELCNLEVLKIHTGYTHYPYNLHIHLTITNILSTWTFTIDYGDFLVVVCFKTVYFRPEGSTIILVTRRPCVVAPEHKEGATTRITKLHRSRSLSSLHVVAVLLTAAGNRELQC